jgi:hypothetical protein
MKETKYLKQVDSNLKSIISSAISSSLKYRIIELKNISGFKHSFMSKYVVKWDLIYNSIIDLLQEYKDKYEYHLSMRGIWRILLIADKETGLMCSVIKLERFSQLKNSKRSKFHYLDILASINKDLHSTNEQIKIDGVNITESINNFDNAILKDNLDKLVKDFNSYINKYFLVAFVENENELLKLKAFMPDKNLNIVESEDWSDLIEPSYDLVIPDDNENYKEQYKEIPLPLKKEAFRKRTENLSKLNKEVIERVKESEE